MKKIIATVLAMVMALALCTTAFAADLTIDGVNYTKVAPDKDLTLEKVYTKEGDSSGSTISRLVLRPSALRPMPRLLLLRPKVLVRLLWLR